MPSAYVSKFGDWIKAGVVLQTLNTKLIPDFQALLYENGNLVLQKMKDHIDKQDLGWTPLSSSTVIKKGSNTIYVETGYLRNNLKVRKVKAPQNGLTIFIGANAWDKHPNGMSLSKLMIYLEYGTSDLPPRPLVRPTWEEVQPLVKSACRNLIESRCGGK